MASHADQLPERGAPAIAPVAGEAAVKLNRRERSKQSVKRSRDRMGRLLLVALMFGGQMVSQLTGLAATIVVANGNDNGPGSLRQAISNAAPCDFISFSISGTITLTNGELLITKELHIT